MIELAQIPGKGRGVMALRGIQQGQVLEHAPASRFSADDRQAVNRTAVFEHYFVLPSEYRLGRWVPGYIVFGLTSICNHAEDPNATVRWRENGLGLWADLEAIREIAAGEEVTVYYTNIDEYEHAEEFV